MDFRARCYIRNALFIFGCLCVAAPLSINAQNPLPLEVTAADGKKLRYVVEWSGIPCIVVNGVHYQLTTAIIRAGDLADRATFFRNDLAFLANPAFPKNRHTFLTNIAGAPAVAAVAVGAQSQIAIFFASSGVLTIDPDGPGPLFEVPIVGPLPEELAFIP